MELHFEFFDKKDLKFINGVRNSHAMDYLHDSSVFTLEETKKWFQKTKSHFYIIKLNKDRVGYFRISNYSKKNKNLYIGADLHPEYTGQGLGYLAYKEFLPYVFEKYDLHKVMLEVLPTNERAINLYKKLNFKVDGVKREEVLKEGEWCDSIMMSVLKKELCS